MLVPVTKPSPQPCKHWNVRIQPIEQQGSDESYINTFRATCADCGKVGEADAWRKSPLQAAEELYAAIAQPSSETTHDHR